MSNKSVSASIIIPNFNGFDLLEKNLPFVMNAYRNRENKILEILVVDDGSKDLSIKFIKRFYPKIKVIRHKINRGFSAAVNTGARSARGELLVLINNDVVPEPDFLKNVIPHFTDEKIFAVSLHEKGYGWARAKFEKGFILHDSGPESKKTHETFWVSGGSGVFRRDYWMKLGGMDEKLLSPYYWEDVDLCYRAMKRGWFLIWEPNARVLHEHESTTGKISKKYRQRIQERNQLLTIWKNITSPRLLRKHVFGLFRRVGRHPGYLRIVFMAVVKVGYILKARRREIKESKISDEAIFAKF